MNKIKNNKKLTKGAIVSICLASILCISLTITGIVLLSRNKFNLENTYISNISEYSAFGVGSGNYNSTAISTANAQFSFDSTTDNFVYAAENNQSNKNYKNAKLYGINKNTKKYEKIVFKDDKNNSIEQKWDVADFKTLGGFSLIAYSNDGKYNNNKNSFEFAIADNVSNYQSYIIHHSTGKIFSTINIFNISGINLENFAYNNDVLYWAKSEYNSGVYFTSIVKLTVEDNQLKMETIANSSQLQFNTNNMIVDKFGNLLLKSSQQSSSMNSSNYSRNYKYVISNNKTLTVLEDNTYLFKSVNGYIYTSDLTKKLDETGTLINNPDNVGIVNSEFLEYATTINNEDYYFCNTAAPNNIIKLYKISWIDETNFNATEIDVSNYNTTSQYVFTNNRIYFLDEQSITYLELPTLNFNNLISDYVFYNIESDNQGNVYFEALNNSLQEVFGIISNNGLIDITISDNDFTVLYISPIN